MNFKFVPKPCKEMSKPCKEMFKPCKEMSKPCKEMFFILNKKKTDQRFFLLVSTSYINNICSKNKIKFLLGHCYHFS